MENKLISAKEAVTMMDTGKKLSLEDYINEQITFAAKQGLNNVNIQADDYSESECDEVKKKLEDLGHKVYCFSFVKKHFQICWYEYYDA